MFSHWKELFQKPEDFSARMQVTRKYEGKPCSKILCLFGSSGALFSQILIVGVLWIPACLWIRFSFGGEMETCRLTHDWTRASRCEELMLAEAVLVSTPEYKGDTLGETQQEFFMFCSFPARSLCSRSKPHWTATLRLFFFFPMGAVTSVYPFVAMASALTLLPL